MTNPLPRQYVTHIIYPGNDLLWLTYWFRQTESARIHTPTEHKAQSHTGTVKPFLLPVIPATSPSRESHKRHKLPSLPKVGLHPFHTMTSANQGTVKPDTQMEDASAAAPRTGQTVHTVSALQYLDDTLVVADAVGLPYSQTVAIQPSAERSRRALYHQYVRGCAPHKLGPPLVCRPLFPCLYKHSLSWSTSKDVRRFAHFPVDCSRLAPALAA